MTRYRALLFDWRLTLAHYPHPKWWIERALRSIERPVDEGFVNQTFDSVGEALTAPEYLDALDSIDSSAEQHRAVMLRVFESAGLDDELALALYDLDFDPVCHPLYPDVPSVLTAIRERRCDDRAG